MPRPSIEELDGLYLTAPRVAPSVPSIDEIDALYRPGVVSRVASAVGGAVEHLKNLPKVVTEGVPAMAEAFIESQSAPTYGQTLAQGPLGYTPIPGALDLAERGLRLITSTPGKMAAEIGPEKAKPLTEALVENAVILPPKTAARALTGDVRSLLARNVPSPAVPPPPVKPVLALPPAAYPMPPGPPKLSPIETAQRLSPEQRAEIERRLTRSMGARRTPVSEHVPLEEPVVIKPAPGAAPTGEIPTVRERTEALTPSRLVDAQGRPVGPVEIPPRRMTLQEIEALPEGPLRAQAEIVAERMGVKPATVAELDALYASEPAAIAREAEREIETALRTGTPEPAAGLAGDERGFLRLGGRQKVPTPSGTGLADIDAMTEAAPTKPGLGQRWRDFKTRVLETQTNRFDPARVLDEAQAAAGLRPARGEGIVENLELVPNRVRGNIQADVREVGRAYRAAYDAGLEDQVNQYLTLKQFEKRIQVLSSRPGTNVDPLGRTAAGGYVNPRQFDLPKVQQAMAQLRGQLTPEQMQRVESTAQSLWATNRRLLDEAHDVGIVSDEVYRILRARGDEYVPIQVLDYLTEAGRGAGVPRGPALRGQNVVKLMEGTERDVRNTIESTVDRIARVRSQIEKNRIGRKITDLNRTLPGLIQQVGGDVFRLPGPDRAVITVFEDGARVNYAVPTGVARALTYLDAQQVGFIERLLGKAAQPLRVGATGANLGFAVTNHVRDLKRLLLFSRFGIGSPTDLVTLPLDYARGLFHAIHGGALGKADQLYETYLRSGAAFSTIQKNLTPEQFLRTAAGVGLKRSAASNVLHAPGDVLKALLHTAQEFNSLIEETPKLTSMIRGARKGATPAEIAVETANFGGSPNFARAGSLGRELNLLWMFYNARLQGSLADLRRFREAPAATLAKLGLATYAPGVTLWAHNRQFDGQQGIEDISEQERQRYWIILRDETYQASDGTTRRKYWKVAKEESEQVTWPLLEGALSWLATNDPPSVARLAAEFVGTASPIAFDLKGTPTVGEVVKAVGAGALSSANPLIRLPAELAANYNASQQGPIVPRALAERTLPEEQIRATTSPTMKRLAGVLGVSPIKLEYAVTSGTGGLGQSVLDALDKALGEALPETVGEYERAARLPGASRVLGRGGDQVNRETEARFYQVYDEAQRIEGSINAAGEKQGNTERALALATAPETQAKLAVVDTFRDIAKQLTEVRQAQVFVTHYLEAPVAQKTAALRMLAEARQEILDAYRHLETLTGKFTRLPEMAAVVTPARAAAPPVPGPAIAGELPEEEETEE